MRVRLLGTGASDGWPDPWCRCGSCAAAVAQGVLRGQAGALVEDRLLLDLGPELPRAAVRQGVDLAGVRGVLVTHAHDDHAAAAPLMWRSWQPDEAPLVVAGPPAALSVLRRRASPAVELRPVAAGDALTVAGFEVRVLPAAHGEGSPVLYDVTGTDGTRLLYATDTGVLPDEALALAADRAYDVVLLELTSMGPMGTATHLDLATWPQQVDRLRAAGAVTPATRVLATHLGHGNPPPDVLDALLASWGAAAARDGQVLDTTAPAAHRLLVLGGARSGKSAYAESRVDGAVTYVATAPERPGDEEWSARVAAHVLRRPAGWTTVETGDVAAVLWDADGPVLVDDLGLWLVRVLDDAGWDEAAVPPALERLAAAWRDARVPVVLVAPEVGGGVVPEHRSGRVFRDLLGTATATLAAGADEVVQVVAGLPRRLR